MIFKIGDKLIGDSHPALLVAELSANHNGSLETAIKTIQAAKFAGADAIKLQTYTPDTITIDVDNDYFKINYGTIWDGNNLYELYKETYTPWEWHEKLFEVARDEGLLCFSSPFDNSSIDFLETLDCPAYKIASPEVVDTNLITYAASKGKPMIISTGIADKNDICEAINSCKKAGNDQIALLKCTAQYPAKIEDANLSMIPEYKKEFNVIPGLSDHTLGDIVPVSSTILGAKIIEKHFILDKSIGGADAAFSLDTVGFSEMVKKVRSAESSLGKIDYSLSKKTRKDREFSSRSLFIVEDIERGEVLTTKHVRSIRPGYGLHPKFLNSVMGKVMVESVKKGQPLKWEMLD
ncbi:MAG: pseudaminic acid synthase [Ekhidna sp.]